MKNIIAMLLPAMALAICDGTPTEKKHADIDMQYIKTNDLPAFGTFPSKTMYCTNLQWFCHKRTGTLRTNSFYNNRDIQRAVSRKAMAKKCLAGHFGQPQEESPNLLFPIEYCCFPTFIFTISSGLL